jgi:hypothetical protein
MEKGRSMGDYLGRCISVLVRVSGMMGSGRKRGLNMVGVVWIWGVGKGERVEIAWWIEGRQEFCCCCYCCYH